MLEIEAQVRRVEVNRPFHVGDQVANTVKCSISLCDGGFGGRVLGRRIHRDLLALQGYEDVRTPSTEGPGAEFHASANRPEAWAAPRFLGATTISSALSPNERVTMSWRRQVGRDDDPGIHGCSHESGLSSLRHTGRRHRRRGPNSLLSEPRARAHSRASSRTRSRIRFAASSSRRRASCGRKFRTRRPQTSVRRTSRIGGCTTSAIRSRRASRLSELVSPSSRAC